MPELDLGPTMPWTLLTGEVLVSGYAVDLSLVLRG